MAIRKFLLRTVVFAAAFLLCLSAVSFAGTAQVKTKSSSKAKKSSSKKKNKNKVRKVKISGLKSGYVIKSGSTRKLKVKITPKKLSDKKVKWKSTNKNVASVKDGRLTAGKAGTAYVYAVCDNKKSNEIKVVVGRAATGIKVSAGGEGYVLTGYKLKLGAEVLPSGAAVKEVKWSSSDKNIAKVNKNGTVTGVSEGRVTITATSKDGHGAKGKYILKVCTLKKGDTKFIAHQGLSAKAPGNTAAAFELAGQYGFWGAECDVWETLPQVTGDSSTTRFAISHNDNLQGIYGVNIKITDSVPSQLEGLTAVSGNSISDFPNQKLPFIEDYLEICRKYSMTPVIEIKQASMKEDSVKRLMEIIAGYVSLDNVGIISFHSSVLEKVKEAADEAGAHPSIMYLYSDLHSKDAGVSNVYDAIDMAQMKGFSGLGVNYRIVNDQIMAYAAGKGMKVSCYTVNSRKRAYELLKAYDLWSVTTDKLLFDE